MKFVEYFCVPSAALDRFVVGGTRLISNEATDVRGLWFTFTTKEGINTDDDNMLSLILYTIIRCSYSNHQNGEVKKNGKGQKCRS